MRMRVRTDTFLRMNASVSNRVQASSPDTNTELQNTHILPSFPIREILVVFGG